MERIKELKQRLDEIDADQRAILDDADDGKLSADQRTKYDAYEDEYDTKLAEFDLLSSDLERANKVSARKGLTIPASDSRKSQPDELSFSDDARITVRDKKFLCLGDQLQAIAGVELSGQRNEMLNWEQLAPATGSAQAGIPSDGGYLIQKDFLAELGNAMLSEATLPAVRTIPIGPNSDGLKLSVVNQTSRATGSRWGGVQVYWGAEADAATAKKPAFRLMELELKDLIGLAYATNRLLQDASALESVFIQAFSEEMTFMKENARINGTGAGQPKGITPTTGASATIAVAKETGQAATTIVYENVIKMWSRLWARGRSNAVWLINQDVEQSLMQMTLDVGTGGVPVYLPPGGVSESPFGRLMGRPVLAVEYCATLGTVGDIILWDPTQYVEIIKGGLQADQSVHVRFTTNENTFRFISRVDGQPMWNSAVTPFKGSNTQSPQIVLATRS